jgi:hypothetical protein
MASAVILQSEWRPSNCMVAFKIADSAATLR